MCDVTGSAFVQALEGRVLFSTAAFTAGGWLRPATSAEPAAIARSSTSTTATASPAVRRAEPASKSKAKAQAAPRQYVVGFYGLGGASFGNSWLAETVDSVGASLGATTQIYQQDDGQTAVTDFFAFIDTNGDHILSAAEIADVTVNVIGYSFGGIQASEFTRALTATGRRGLYGYRLAEAVPVHTLVTIDPVNNQPEKHTDGPLRNVGYFLSYYQSNPGSSTITLTARGAAKSASTYTFDGTNNPVGSVLSSAARYTSQTLVDDGGPLADVTVTQAYSHYAYGTLQGADVNHMTMPWFLYSRVLADFTG